jgi:hypothetical protein
MRLAHCLSILFVASGSIASANVATATGDIILGFRALRGTGADVCLEVNLGPASDFTAAASGSTSILTRLSIADLSETYGSDWSTRTDLFWGIVGTTGLARVNGAPLRTIWASRPETSAGVASEPWPRGVTFSLQVPSNRISSLYTGAPGSLDRYNATTNSIYSATVPAEVSGSWSAQELFTPGVSFSYFNPSVSAPISTFGTIASNLDGTRYNVLDLWEVRPGAAGSASTLVGGFGINADGKLVFARDVSVFGGTAPPSPMPLLLITRNIPAGTIKIDTETALSSGTYIWQRSDVLSGAWTNLETRAGVSGLQSYTDNSPPIGRAFYRLKRE